MKETGSLEVLAAAGIAFGPEFLDHPEEDLLEDLAVEYTRLFIGPGSHIPPYASVHLGGKGASLWGTSAVQVQRFIKAAGFEYRPDYHDLPDHVSIEFEFMQEVTKKEAQAWHEKDFQQIANSRNIEKEFISKHVWRWVPVFCEKVVGEAELPFYGEMAKLTRRFIDTEYDELVRWAARGIN